MGADSENMLAKLQLALSQQQNQGPNLYGLTAAQDPNQTAQILSKLQAQNYVNQQGNANPSDLFSIVANAGKKDFARLGQNIAGMAGIGTPQQYDNSATMAQRDAIRQGNAQVSSDLANGVDPEQAKINALTKAAQQGVPGAADLLDKAVDARQKNLQSIADTQQKLEQAKSYGAADSRDKAKEARETAQNTWTTDPNVQVDQYHMAQTNGLGETRIVAKGYQPNAATIGAAAAADPSSVNYVAEYMKANGGNPPSNMRSPALVQAAIKQLGAQGDAGDVVAGIVAKHAENQSDKAALTQTTKQLAATGTYINTFDKNAAQLGAQADKLGLNDPTILNKAINAYNRGTSDPDYAKYAVFLNTVGNEYAKIQSGSLGNAPLSDSARHEGQTILPPELGASGIKAVIDAMRTDSKNKIDSLNDTQKYYSDKLAGKKPVFPGSSAAAPAATPAAGSVVDFSSLK